LITVFRKELSDHFTSWRFIILFALVLLAGVLALYVDAHYLTGESVTSTKLVFLKLYTTYDQNLPGFLQFLNLIIIFFVPIVGIALGFDAINEEKNVGTMSRLLSQPIYRDAVITGKFLAGIVTMAIMLVCIVLIVAGIGLRMIGVPPTSEEVIRLMAFVGMCVVYGAFWLGLAMLFSVLFRRVATSALASIAVWIFLFFFIPMLSGLIANIVAPIGQSSTLEEQLGNIGVQIAVYRISPIYLFQETVNVLLVPELRTMSQMLQLQTSGMQDWMLPNPLSLGQSLLVVWPHLVSLVTLTVVCFAISYIKFMREEIRST
jgi:ABC-2 type transport system permease protein